MIILSALLTLSLSLSLQTKDCAISDEPNIQIGEHAPWSDNATYILIFIKEIYYSPNRGGTSKNFLHLSVQTTVYRHYNKLRALTPLHWAGFVISLVSLPDNVDQFTANRPTVDIIALLRSVGSQTSRCTRTHELTHKKCISH